MTTATVAGLSRGRLQNIDRFLEERYVAPGKLPGALTMVARHGEIAHLGLVGSADVERGAPLKEDTIFRIYSMTKPITSVAFMMLVEEGKVAIDDAVEKYIPAWKGLGVFVAGQPGAWQTRPTSRPMQIVDLLRHTSGLTYGFQNRSNVDAAYRKESVGGAKMTLEGMIATLAEIPLEFSPGDAWNYSNSTDVLGYLVQAISGQPFAEFLRTRIFEPLGMVDTAFHVSAEKASRLAACYNRNPATGALALQDDPAKSPYLAPPAFVSGGGGLTSTAADYMKFCQMLLNGGTLGGARLISRKTLALMTQNHLPGRKDMVDMTRSTFSEASNAGVGFGLGFAVVQDTARYMINNSLGEYYWGGAASTAFWVDPVEDLTVVFMTQFMPSSFYPVRRELRTLVYAVFDD